MSFIVVLCFGSCGLVCVVAVVNGVGGVPILGRSIVHLIMLGRRVVKCVCPQEASCIITLRVGPKHAASLTASIGGRYVILLDSGIHLTARRSFSSFRVYFSNFEGGAVCYCGRKARPVCLR